MRPAVAYTRVSSAEQLREGFSIAAQLIALREYAERHDFAIVAEFSDDETAKTTGRSDFARMIDHLHRNPSHAILVEKTDRLYRNLKDYITIDELGVEIHFVKEGGRNANHADGRFMHGIRVLIARKYVENLSEEVKKGMRQKCREGGWPTWSPLGYLNVKEATEKKRTGGIIPDPAKADLVRELFNAADTGAYSLGDLERLAQRIGLQGRNGTTLRKQAISYVMHNRAYIGEIEWSGVVYAGKYEPLIDREQFERVQSILAVRAQVKARKHEFTYAGIARCGSCGGLLTGDVKKGRYVYYACRGAKGCKRFYREAAFDAKMSEQLHLLSGSERHAALIVSHMRKWYAGTAEKSAARAAMLRKRASELRNLQAAAYEDKLRGLILEDEWRALAAKWRSEVEEIERELLTIAPVVDQTEFIKRVMSPFELVKVAADQYLTYSAINKGRIVKTCCSNFLVTEGSISIQLRSPFDVLAEIGSSQDWLANLDDLRTLRLWALGAAA
jgi:site-specific DNA recombinase